jgi:hypothetical protein
VKNYRSHLETRLRFFLLRPIRMRQRSFMVKHAPKVPAIDPAAASLTSHEVVGIVASTPTGLPTYLPRGIIRSSKNSSGISGIVTSDALQAGQGAPAPPQAQARGPSHGLSGWFSQTHW